MDGNSALGAQGLPDQQVEKVASHQRQALLVCWEIPWPVFLAVASEQHIMGLNP